MQGTTLREQLTEWTDWDLAGYLLARRFGLMKPGVDFQVDAKHVFWSNSPVGVFLHELLEGMVKLGILEKRDEPDFQYR